MSRHVLIKLINLITLNTMTPGSQLVLPQDRHPRLTETEGHACSRKWSIP
jgi:hypothetical protein